MDTQAKNTIKIRTFHRKLAFRLGLVGLTVAVVFGFFTWWNEGEKIIGKVTDRAIQGTELFNDQINYLIKSPDWQDKAVMGREDEALKDQMKAIRDKYYMEDAEIQIPKMNV